MRQSRAKFPNRQWSGWSGRSHTGTFTQEFMKANVSDVFLNPTVLTLSERLSGRTALHDAEERLVHLYEAARSVTGRHLYLTTLDENALLVLAVCVCVCVCVCVYTIHYTGCLLNGVALRWCVTGQFNVIVFYFLMVFSVCLWTNTITTQTPTIQSEVSMLILDLLPTHASCNSGERLTGPNALLQTIEQRSLGVIVFFFPLWPEHE